ncbi:Peptidase M28 multi-domain protein [Pyrenophora teres f. maculata]|nr:Peptidase M28 multi-domain protein [Pyrenophora teres f. maculata]
MVAPSDPRCVELAHPDLINFGVSIFIVVGILVSYLPQHFKIIARRSSRGLSPMFVLLGTVSGTASIANILTLPESTRDMDCCKDIGGFPCAAAMLGIVQIAVQWACFFFIMLLFLIFFPRASDAVEEQDTDMPTWKEAVLVLGVSIAFFVVSLFGSVVFVYAIPSHVRGWANFLGLLASLLAAIQYLPQIAMTWRLQETGSLSIPMMIIQTPGSFVFAASLYARLGPRGWSAWGLFIFTGFLQGILLAMALSFVWRDRKARQAKELEVASGGDLGMDTERTPLLDVFKEVKMKISSGLALAGAAQTWAAVAPRPMVSSEAIQAEIKTEKLMGNLEAFDDIAKANGGNRAFGLPGYAASVDYMLAKTQNTHFKTWTQDFPALFNQISSISFSVSNTSYRVIGLSYSPSTTPEGLTLPLVLGASGPEGCTNEAYDKLDVAGKIVLVQRGSCPDGTTLAGRMKPAAAAGASAVIIYASDTANVTGGTLSNPNPDYVSTGYISLADASPLVARLQAGEALTAHFQQTQTVETRITQNVFTETKDGDPTNVIMLGAHLDSVQAGAGINDDGSGTTLILELAKALRRFKVKNKVRFAWWGAEENGLLGSKYYTQNLAPADANNILTYLNFDMVSRGYLGVFDGDGSAFNLSGAPGSAAIERLFVQHFERRGLVVTPARFTGGSDYQSFMNIGKPVGGLHTGTGVAQDPCYHQACDTIDNPNPETLTINAKAAAHVLSILATRGEEIIPKSPVNASMITNKGIMGVEPVWTVPGEGEMHLATCGHDV